MKTPVVILALLLSSTLAFVESSATEINYLIDSVGRDGCGLVRATSGEPYQIKSQGEQAQLAGEWFDAS